MYPELLKNVSERIEMVEKDGSEEWGKGRVSKGEITHVMDWTREGNRGFKVQLSPNDTALAKGKQSVGKKKNPAHGSDSVYIVPPYRSQLQLFVRPLPILFVICAL
ncbi:hypothetical protein E2C01_036531 [Portunus trituberculatus]|uniref:Uncharacterized protein n=1 Tax=Portunus trituberculatus TaxID=210409 RepID=A0A5B7FCB1_PORTR|nr:hypothetical protein [Portunus trituberculatus]